jgi:hypothetical protein
MMPPATPGMSIMHQGRVRRACTGLRAESRGHAIHRRCQRRQILFDDQPDCPEVNAQVAMHDHVAKPGEFAPWHLRLGAPDLARQALA